ncbi:MAG TPA: ABC transporter permease [Gemmatimonadaceae bacterium]|nr:ABC transporter permease [Gemmatimonadaceae bacterium]
MSFLDALRHRIDVRLRPRAYLRELDEELEFHLSLDAMQREHAGRGDLTPAAARHAARRRFGNLTTTRARTRHMAGLGLFDAVRADLRFALHTFRRTPGFTAAAVLTLALGIGANTAIFSAVHTLLLRPLPFPAPERLMKVSLTFPAEHDSPGNDDVVWSYPKFVVYREAQRSFSDLALYSDRQYTITGGGADAERVDGELAGARYLTTLGVRPSLGRNFAADEDRHAGGPRVALLGDALWRRRFGADPRVIGRSVAVGGQPYTIVGVMPAGFRGLSGRSELWVPVLSQPAEEVDQAWAHSYWVVARLAPGVTPEQAAAEARRLGPAIYRSYPNPVVPTAMPWGATARELDATRVDPLVRRAVLVLFGAVALVLLIACANVANLFLVRAAGRRKEIAVRLSIGAGRGRLVRQLLTESVLLASLGGAAGIAVAWWGVKLLAALAPETALGAARFSGLGAVIYTPIRLDATALAFAAALSVATGLIFGLVPALQATRPSLTEALADGTASASGGTRARGARGISTRALLAAGEVAVAVVLLAGSGLMLRSLDKLLRVHPGFDADHVLTMRVDIPESMGGGDSLPNIRDRLLERVAAMPGVTTASMSDCPPLRGGCNGTVIVFRDRPPAAPGTEPSVGIHWATPSWFAAMRIPLRRGRLFDGGDRVDTRKVVLVNETAARRFWPNQDPIGRPVSVGQGGFWTDTAYVVGVVGDVRYGTVDSLPAPDVYLSYAQSPVGRNMLFVRTAGDPLAVVPAVRRALHELSPDAPVHDVKTMAARVADATASARFSTVLLTLFGVVALVLATIGTYGVIAYATAQRTQEIGVRMALGATAGDVTRLVVGQGIAIAAIGGALGLAGAFAATRVLRALLYGVGPSDPVTFVGITAVLAVAVLAANWIPARRAARIDPMVALRRG